MAKERSSMESLVTSRRVSKDFWKNKKVFLTGHTGFKGSWLSMWLNQLGADVYGYSLEAPTTPSLFDELNLSKHIKSIKGDIRDYKNLKNHILGFNPQIIIHMAAQPLVRYSYINPLETYEVNVMGVANAMHAAMEVKDLECFLNVTSDKCYENNELDWSYKENEPMGGYDPYSNSKGCSELVTSSFRQSFFSDRDIGLSSARAGNVIGGGDWAADRLIPDILKAFELKERVIIRNPDAIRPWQHVLEPLSGYLILIEDMYVDKAISGGWNFGPNEEDAKKVSWIVEQLAKLWGNNASWQLDSATNPHEASYLKLDISKAKNQLNWSPNWTLDQALEKITEWHKSWINKQDIWAITENHIQSYNR